MIRMRNLALLLTAALIVSTMHDNTSADDSLGAQLDAAAEASKERLPATLRQTFTGAIDTVRGTGIESSAKNVGDDAPDATLTGWDGNEITLSDQWSKQPVVLMWYRGGWCPYCNIQLRAMQKSLDQLEGAGAKLIVLTPELPEKAKQTAEQNDLDLIALHDQNNQVARDYGILFELPASIVPTYRDRLKLPQFNGNDDMSLPLAATYVINTDGKITYAFLDSDYKKRAEPADVIAAIKDLDH